MNPLNLAKFSPKPRSGLKTAFSPWHWPGDWSSNLPLFSYDRFCGGLWLDIKRKIPFYCSDIYDGFHIQSISAVLFIYLGCITNAITFGGLLGDATDSYQVFIKAETRKSARRNTFLVVYHLLLCPISSFREWWRVFWALLWQEQSSVCLVDSPSSSSVQLDPFSSLKNYFLISASKTSTNRYETEKLSCESQSLSPMGMAALTGIMAWTTWSSVCGSASTRVCSVFFWFCQMPATSSSTWPASRRRVSPASSLSYSSLMPSRRWWVTSIYPNTYPWRCLVNLYPVYGPQVSCFKYYPINQGFKPDYITSYKCECIAPDQGESSNLLYVVIRASIIHFRTVKKRALEVYW